MEGMTETQTSTYSRWALILRGIVAVLFGIAVLAWPHATLITIIYLLGAFVLVDGIIAVVGGFFLPGSSKWALILGGVLAVIIGLMVFFWPGITALILLYLVAAWAIVAGISIIVFAFTSGSSVGQEWAYAIAGGVLILLGIFLFFRPGAGILSILWLVGVALIAGGVLQFIRAFMPASARTRIVDTNW